MAVLCAQIATILTTVQRSLPVLNQRTIRVDCGTRRGIGRLYSTLSMYIVCKARRDNETLFTVEVCHRKVLSDMVSEVTTGKGSWHCI